MKQFVQAVMTCLTLGVMVATPVVAQAEVVLVGSKQIPFVQISKTKLRDLYTGQSQTVGSTQVLVLDREEEFEQREQFIFKTLGFTGEEFATVQRLMECIGISKPPTVANNGQHMVDLLLNNSNALGYLSREELGNHPLGFKLRHIKVLAE